MAIKSGEGPLIAQNANILELSYEPGLMLRLRLVELSPTLDARESSRVVDLVFSGIRQIDIAMDLNARNACVSRVSKWAKHLKERKDDSSNNQLALSIETNIGAIKIACTSLERIYLKDILSLHGSKQ